MKEKLRRSGAKIMASLIVLLGSLSYIMVLAVINGSVGFIAAMGVTVAGATGVAKALGVLGLCAEIPLAWGWIIGIAVGCGVVRGGLRYLNNTPTTISRSNCWRFCATKFSARSAYCVPPSSKVSRRAVSSP